MRISVIICTYNRCQLLATALETIAASVFPNPIDWEVLVVDNNSNDRTRQVVEQSAERNPGRIRYLFESQQGKSNALNTAIHAAHGDVLAFTDDDVTVEPAWLWNLTEGLLGGEWVGAAGRIIPQVERPLPSWLSMDEVAAGPFVAFDQGPVAGPLTKVPYGANMAFRREIFQKYGGFRTDLGPAGEKTLKCEDTEFCRRLMKNGERLRYEPAAVVHHPVPDCRLEKGYILSWRYWHAVSDIQECGPPQEAKRFVLGIPPYLLRRLARWSVQSWLSLEPAKRFRCKQNMWHIAGVITGCYRWSRTESRRGPLPS